jgi:N-acetylglutamate synthase-like GNAT family acetyltransferase
MSPLRLEIEHGWAVEAMLASYNHVNRVAHRARYQDLDVVGVTQYDNPPPGSTHRIEFHAYDADPLVVHNAVSAYPRQFGARYYLNVFHVEPAAPKLKARYEELGYRFLRTGPILALDLPVNIYTIPEFIRRIETHAELEIANQGLALEKEHIAPETLKDSRIRNFYAEQDGQAAAWAQFVAIYPDVGCINHFYTLTAYRDVGLSERLLGRLHAEANVLNLKHVVVVTSEQNMVMYRRCGYRPVAYFSVFTSQEMR